MNNTRLAPLFSNDGLDKATQPTPDSSAGLAEITRLEAFWLACIREQDVDMLRTLVNSLTGPGGLKLWWHDSSFESDE